MSYEDIEKFIKDNSITKRVNLRSNHRKIYDSFKKLSKAEQDELLPPNLSNYSNLNTVNDFKSFIKENKITNMFMFQHKFTGAYIRFKKILTKEEQFQVLPTKKPDYTHLKSIEDFVNFIKKNNIKSRKDFNKRFYAAARKMRKLYSEEEIEKVVSKVFDKKLDFLDDLKTLGDFQVYIKSNKILTNIDFYKKHTRVYNKLRKLFPQEEYKTILPQPPKSVNYKNYKSINDFQKYINDNFITSVSMFFHKNHYLYNKFISLFDDFSKISFPIKDKIVYKSLSDFQNYIDNNNIKSYKEFRKTSIYNKYLTFKKEHHIKESLVFPEQSKKVSKYVYLNTIQDFQEYINNNNIKSKKDFRKDNALVCRFYKCIPKEDRQLLLFDEECRHLFLDEFSTIKQFQDFVDEYNIFRPIDFRNDFPKIYDRFCRIIPKEEKHKLIYGKSRTTETKLRSYGERFLIKLLENNDIKFISEKTFSDLKEKSYLRYDLYLPDYNILIEYHGEQHFNKNTLYYSDELLRNDKRKFEYAINSNIKILYFTLHKSSLEKYGYFTEVITDANILIQRIKEIGLTSQSNS